MLAVELAARIAKGENLHTEFKGRLPHADDLAAALVAFANTDGGDVFLGVDDAGATQGVADVDRVEVRSLGGLPNSVRLAQLPAGVHVLRNPTLYNLLLKRGLATDAGSGIPRLIQLVREQTGRAPTLRLAGDEFVVTLPRTANEPDYNAESQVRRQRG